MAGCADLSDVDVCEAIIGHMQYPHVGLRQTYGWLIRTYDSLSLRLPPPQTRLHLVSGARRVHVLMGRCDSCVGHLSMAPLASLAHPPPPAALP